ncbi:Carboxypeptidase activation peptide [Trinorchestia longiramus]|nr:Carboxypeptidase activation peptide [Trinorchestia longiramus]
MLRYSNRVPVRNNAAPSAILSAILPAILPAIPPRAVASIPTITRTLESRTRRSAILPAMLYGCLAAILFPSLPVLVQSSPITRAADAISYKGYKLYRADVFPGQLPIVDSLDGKEGVEVWNWLYRPANSSYQLDVLSAPYKERQVKEVFDDVQLRYNVVIDDLQKEIEMENVNDGFLLDNRFGHPMTWQQYHSFEDMAHYMYYLEQTFPRNVQVLNIGSSFEGRDLLVAKVSTAEFGNTSRPAIWIDGGLHAREWISPAVVSYFLQRLVELPGSYSPLVDTFDWYIMPMVNPDGYEYSRSHDRLWRKTRSKTPESPCYGVDANRNFGFKWNTGGTSGNPCSDTYRGAAPFSELETRALRDFLQEHKQEIEVYLSIHSYKQLWMYPWGYTKAPLSSPANAHVATVATDAINVFAHTDEYQHGRMADQLYVTSGSSNDYAYGALGIPYSFALELRDRGEHGFLLPRDQIEPTAEETSIGLFAMAQQVQELKRRQ